MLDKIIKSFITILGIFVTAAMLLLFVQDVSRVINWSSSGFVLSSIQYLDETTARFYVVNPGDFPSSPVPARQDTLLTIADSTASLDRWIEVLELPHEPGKEAIITYLHDGEVQTTTMKSRPVSLALFWTVVSQLVLRLLIFFGFAGLAFWAFFRSPNSVGIRSLALYAICMAAFMGTVYLPMFTQVPSFQIPFANLLRGTLISIPSFFGSYWLLLNLVFPKRAQLYIDRRFGAYVICFIPTLMIIIAAPLIPDNTPWFGFAALGVILAQIGAGLLILRHNHIHTDVNIEKRQTKLVFWGSGAGLVIFFVYLLAFFQVVRVFRGLQVTGLLMSYNAIFLILLASPISFAYAFGRYRLLEVEARLRRGTQYLITMGVLLAAFGAAVYIVGFLLLESIGISGRTPTLFIALIMALGFAPTQRNLRRRLEKRFFPERLRLRQMVNDFLRSASALPDCGALCGGLQQTLSETLDVKSVYAVLRDNGEDNYHLESGGDVPLDTGGDLFHYLRSGKHPLLVDEAIASSKIIFSAEESSWLIDHDIALLLPLRTGSEVIGFLGLSHKEDYEDFHPEELQLLMTLSDQIAVSIQNLSLLEENLVKRRMEEELKLARSVQMKFLPQELPETPGLKVEAKSTFCLEVAGDYYDVVAIRNDRTLLAVGDVSGKGAGAALIMANLQASLRAYVGLGLRLDDMVARINELIYANTDIDQYITFFVGIYNTQDHSLTYVNAGHNPPFVLQKDGQIRMLETGGLIIGALAEQKYQQETVQLSEGDLIVIYTDGISEAMNAADEEFGEERIMKVVQDYRETDPRTIINQLIDAVDQFRGETLAGDDLTLVVAKVE
jgi:serine phosphatase RsbU (regulator of sigma subunit)